MRTIYTVVVYIGRIKWNVDVDAGIAEGHQQSERRCRKGERRAGKRRRERENREDREGKEESTDLPDWMWTLSL